MQKYLIEILECPKCHGELDWKITEQTADRVVTAEVQCTACYAVYSIQNEIGIFLTEDLPRNDLWEQVAQLEQYLKQNPGLEEKLMDVPIDTLGPVDQHYRGRLHKARGEIEAANEAFSLSHKAMFSEETNRCIDSQMDFVLDEVSQFDCPIMDLASGECELVKKMLKDLPNSIVVTDFSPTVLERDRKNLIELGLYNRVSLLAFDARRTPFKTDSIALLTTHCGLQNIQNPGNLLKELHRIVNGKFLAVSFSYPENDQKNGSVISEAGLAEMYFREKLIGQYRKSNWIVDAKNVCSVKTPASPTGIVLEGAKVDLLPAYETDVEWCVLEATNT